MSAPTFLVKAREAYDLDNQARSVRAHNCKGNAAGLCAQECIDAALEAYDRAQELLTAARNDLIVMKRNPCNPSCEDTVNDLQPGELCEFRCQTCKTNYFGILVAPSHSGKTPKISVPCAWCHNPGRVLRRLTQGDFPKVVKTDTRCADDDGEAYVVHLQPNHFQIVYHTRHGDREFMGVVAQAERVWTEINYPLGPSSDLEQWAIDAALQCACDAVIFESLEEATAHLDEDAKNHDDLGG